MITAHATEDLDRFRAVVAERLGLRFGDDREEQVAEVLRRRTAATGAGAPGAYLALLASPLTARDELRALAEALTVGETYFFRCPDHLRAFVGRALPERLAVARGRRAVHVLSAGCASGEEAYTLALLAREHLPELGPSELAITGIDVNPAAIRRARRGHYAPWSLRETPPDVKQHWFTRDGRGFALADEVRAAVSFEERNLLDADPGFWAPGAFDVIFCRNVTIYFPPETTRLLIARFARCLAPGGYLFLGHAESLRGLSGDFDLVSTHGTFCYQRPLSGTPAVPAPPTSGWYESIHGSAGRIERLAPAASAPRSPAARTAVCAPAPPVPAPVWSLDLARELFRQERFADALRLVHALPDEARAAPDAHLLAAAILVNQGELGAAEAACRRVLTLDRQNAGAYYLAALCREHSGDLPAATRHDQMAVWLDPSFAIAHLHLGRLARRAGDRETAARVLGRALSLLAIEDTTRIALFGGGFGREALARLCRGELAALGVTP